MKSGLNLGVVLILSLMALSFTGCANKDSDVQSNIRVGQLQYDNEDYDAAIASFNKSIQISPTTVGFNGLAWAQFKKNDVDLAIESFQKSIALEPTLKSYQGLSTMYIFKGNSETDKELATDFYEKSKKSSLSALEIDSDGTCDVFTNLALVEYYLNNDTVKVKDYLQKSEDIKMDCNEATIYLKTVLNS